MKRIFAFALMLYLAAAPLCGLAEGIDLSAYDDDVLLRLHAQVQTEIAARHILKSADLAVGTYIGGRDIPVGSYTLTAKPTDYAFGVVSLATPEDGEDDLPSKLYNAVGAGEEFSAFVTTEEGDVLIIPIPFTLTVSGGVTFK